MNLFKKLSPKPQNEAVPKNIITNYSYGEIPVEVEYNIDASMEHLPDDFETLKKEGIDNIIKERFIPWLKTDEFRDRDVELIFKGLKLYSIVYCYAMILTLISKKWLDSLIFSLRVETNTHLI